MNVLNKGKILYAKAPCYRFRILTILVFICPVHSISQLTPEVGEHFTYFLSSVVCKCETSEANMDSLGNCMRFVNSHNCVKRRKKKKCSLSRALPGKHPDLNLYCSSS